MSNFYHILYNLPSLEEDDTYIEVETLARRLVESGRFRVDIDYNTLNFVRFSLPKERIELIFSARELSHPKLLPRTRHIMDQAFLRQHPIAEKRAAKIEAEIKRLNDTLKKYQPVSSDIEMKLARIVVQSTHPVVMMLILWEGVEVFVSYSYAIGDLLHMSSWQSQQYNSGMQSTDGRNAAIYISAGGDPFGKAEKNATYGNGRPALARMMIIGAQELGHYSDIMRDHYGRQISRHSADFHGSRAKENVRLGRIADIDNVGKLGIALRRLGMYELSELEREEKFYHKINRKGLKLWWLRKKIKRHTRQFLARCDKAHYGFVRTCKPIDGHLATTLTMALVDMRFNLEPKADAYSRPDKIEEEAIACIEALARVPQQVVKWGEGMTKAMTPHLYTIYYQQVIPACIIAYEQVSGTPYHFSFTRKKLTLWDKIRKEARKTFSRKKKRP